MHIREEIDSPLPHHVGKVNNSLLAVNDWKCRQQMSILRSITSLQLSGTGKKWQIEMGLMY